MTSTNRGHRPSGSRLSPSTHRATTANRATNSRGQSRRCSRAWGSSSRGISSLPSRFTSVQAPNTANIARVSRVKRPPSWGPGASVRAKDPPTPETAAPAESAGFSSDSRTGCGVKEENPALRQPNDAGGPASAIAARAPPELRAYQSQQPVESKTARNAHGRMPWVDRAEVVAPGEHHHAAYGTSYGTAQQQGRLACRTQDIDRDSC